MSKEELPSIEDLIQKDLPSIDEFLTEEVAEELPSVEDFIENEKTELKEEVQTIEDLNGDAFVEVSDVVPPWPELIRLINDVRKDIPEIPEIKSYDKELENLSEQIIQIKSEIPNVPEVRYYDLEIEEICNQIDGIREYISNSISDLPEVKYYDNQVESIENKIKLIREDISNLPEPKYYENDLLTIKDEIEKVRSEIPTFPKWVNEVNEVPDFSWIGKTFSIIDDDFIRVNDTIENLEEKIRFQIQRLSEENETKHFENKVQFGTEVGDLDKKLKEEKDKIWKELRESSLRIWEYHKEFKDDDRKLKKQISGEYNSLKQNLEEKLKKYNQDSVETDQLLIKYFNDLKEEISNLPEVKYYDEDLRHVKTDLKELRNLVRTIKTEQETLQESLQEGLLNEPPEEKEDVGGKPDPLTPMDQKFATLDDLSNHYRLFINRIQQQISTIGGGGAGFIKDLDDVEFDQTSGEGKLLIYDQANSKWVGIASTSLGTGSGISTATVDGSGDLIITLNDSSQINAGHVVGPTGPAGIAGTTGASAGLRFTYNSGPGFQDPGDGKFSINRNSVSTFSPTLELIFSYQSADGIAVNTLISKWDDNTTQTNRGVVMISKADGTQQSWWYITGAYAVAGTGLWNHTPATFLGGSTAFTNNTDYFVTFVRNGDKGDTGATGPVAGSANQVVYKDGSNNPAGSNNLTFDGTTLTASSLSVTGNVSIAGTLTYEDVTNIDSIGLITARTGIQVLAGGIDAVGVITATSFSGSGSNLTGIVTGITAGANIEILETPSGNFIITATDQGGNQNLDSVLTQGNVSGIGLSVGVSTFSGNVYIGSGVTITSNDINIVGVITANTGSFNNFTIADTLTIGNQVIYAQGYDGYSVNEDFDPSNVDYQTAYHYTSGIGRSEVAFTLARTNAFTNGFGIYGTSANNTFVNFGEASNTNWEWRTGVGIRPLDLDGGTLLVKLSSNGNLGIGTTNPTSKLDVNGDTKISGILTVAQAFYPPIYTTSQRDSLTFGEGAIIFNTTDKKMQFYDGTSWQDATGLSLGLAIALDG